MDDNNIFVGRKDSFGGIEIQSTEYTTLTVSQFSEKLKKSLQQWEECGVHAVWFHVTSDQSSWIPILSEHKFLFHHTSHDGKTLSLYLWLPKDRPCLVPVFAHTMVGAGGVVINDNDEVLVIKEQSHAVPHWKFPGGFVEPGEELDKAAEREVFEETGITAKFDSLILFRHTHQFQFNTSDMYFAFKLTPITFDIKIDENEIRECMWMDIRHFIEKSDAFELNKNILRSYLSNGSCIKKEVTLHPNRKKNVSVYSIRSSDTSS